MEDGRHPPLYNEEEEVLCIACLEDRKKTVYFKAKGLEKHTKNQHRDVQKHPVQDVSQCIQDRGAAGRAFKVIPMYVSSYLNDLFIFFNFFIDLYLNFNYLICFCL